MLDPSEFYSDLGYWGSWASIISLLISGVTLIAIKTIRQSLIDSFYNSHQKRLIEKILNLPDDLGPELTDEGRMTIKTLLALSKDRRKLYRMYPPFFGVKSCIRIIEKEISSTAPNVALIKVRLNSIMVHEGIK